MKRQKLLFLLLAPFALAMLPACSDSFVEIDPEGPAVPVESLTPGDISGLVTGAYSNLYEWNQHSFSYMGMSSIASDEADKGSSPGDTGSDKHELDAFTYSSTLPSARAIWESNYLGISMVHRALEAIESYEGEELAEEDLTWWTGEMRFLRGYYYFILVRAFGDVPLVTRTLNPAEEEDFEIANTRVAASEVYAQIESDLDFAAGNLAAKGEREPGRITSGAAKALLAKVHLYQQEWQEAYDQTTEIINSGIYGLHPNYEEIWREVGEFNSGSIWEIPSYPSFGDPRMAIQQYATTQGVRGQFGWGFNSPSQALVDAYEPGDPRMDATIIFIGDPEIEGDEEVMWDGVQIVDAGPDLPRRYSEKMYVSRVAETWDGNAGLTNKNMRVIRYAEVLLIHAEAANELGMTAEALDALNKVRERARGGNPEILPDVTVSDKAGLRDAIWHERHVELAMEWDRFWDVIRQGQVVDGRDAEILGPLGFDPQIHRLYPIPQEEIDLSENRLTQNPGY